MPKGIFPRKIKTFEEKTANRQCKYCGDKLVLAENWNMSEAKVGIYKCRPCGSVSRERYNTHGNREAYRDKLSARPVDPRQCKNCSVSLEIGVNWTEYRRLARTYKCADCLKPRTQVQNRNRKKAMRLHPSANPEKVEAFYALSRRLTALTGTPYNVDHIVSFARGGIHHEDNLVVMTAKLNQTKHSKDWPWLSWFNDHAE